MNLAHHFCSSRHKRLARARKVGVRTPRTLSGSTVGISGVMKARYAGS